MPYRSSSTNTQQRRSPIASYRTHIPCGNYSCRHSCDNNCLQCVACLKFFHYKCKKLKRKDHLNFQNNNLDFVCSDECYRSYLPFFEFINPIEFLEDIFEHDGLYPCKRCKLECLDGNLMDCIQCEICENWYHAECANLQQDFVYYIEGSCGFICSARCSLSVLPFYQFDLEYPCKNCGLNCLAGTNCIQCDYCLNP